MSKKKKEIQTFTAEWPGTPPLSPEEGFTYPYPVDEKEEKNPDLLFTGIARSVVCSNVNKTFRNFRILTLHIEEGKVVKVEKSDAYTNFETIVRAEIMNEKACMNLDMNYKDGQAWRK